LLAWTPDYDDGDVAYIARPPGPSPSSAVGTSTLSMETVIEEQSHPHPSPHPSSVGEMSGHENHWTSAVSSAYTTIGEGPVPRVPVSEENAPSTLQEERPPECVTPCDEAWMTISLCNIRSYVEALLPTTPVDYSFRLVEGDSNSMVVVPPMDVTDTRPLYHIRVVHDLFDPSFFVTSIRKGGNDGHFVGDFR